MLRVRKKAFDILQFGSKFLFLVPIEKRNIDLYALVSNRKIILGPSTDELDEDDLAYIIAHCALSLILQHDKRHENVILPGEEPIWNLASEICRTSVLYDLRVSVNKEIFLRPSDFDLEPGLSIEEYFLQLRNTWEKWKDNVQAKIDVTSKEGQGQGQGQGQRQGQSQPQSGEGDSEGESDEIPEELKEALSENPLLKALQKRMEESDIDDIAREALLNEAMKDAMNVLGRSLLSRNKEIKKLLRDLRRVPNPFEDLIQFIGSKLGSTEFRRLNISRPNRRYQSLSNVIIPAYMRQGYDKIAVIVDISGSVHGIIKRIAEALYSIGQTFRDSLDVYFSDITVVEKQMGFTPESFQEIPLGGGTDLGPVADEILKKNEYQTLIMITDGLTSWPQKRRGTAFYCWLLLHPGTDIKELQIPNYIDVRIWKQKDEDYEF